MADNEAKLKTLAAAAPAGGGAPTASQPAAAATTTASPSAVCWHCSLHVFKFNTSANQFEAVGGGVCGMAILGSVTTFNIVIYDRNKTTLVMTPLNGVQATATRGVMPLLPKSE